MTRHKLLWVFSLMMAAGSAQAGELMVAEFRADQSVLAGGAGSPLGDDPLVHPGNLYAEEVGGSQEKSWVIGPYTFSSVMDWGHRANYLAGERYSDEQFFSLGSRIQLGDSSETRIFYGYGRDRLGAAADLYGDFGDAQSTRTGLSQTLFFADQQASVGVGYAYATGDRAALYQGRQGHELELSGDFEIGWGFNAHLQAGYGLYSYNRYQGVSGDLSSARTNMRAGISRAFTPGLSWGLQYSYVDEEFETSSLSETRETWGLNLEYQY